MAGNVKMDLEEVEFRTDSLMLGCIEHVNYVASFIKSRDFHD
jgi:hypothetical protein